MTIRATAFTPATLLSAPRRSPGIPNHDGTHVLYTTSAYSFETQEWGKEVRVMSVATGESFTVMNADGVAGVVWMADGEELVAVRAKKGENGGSEVVCGEWKNWEQSNYVIETIDATVSEIKITPLDSGAYVLVVVAPANPDYSLYNEKKAPKPKSTGRLYSSLFIRHWDHWITPQRNALWIGELFRGGHSHEQGDTNASKGRWSLSPLINILKNTNLECPVDEAGASGGYDIGKHGLVFIAKDPNLCEATNTKRNIYTVAIDSFRKSPRCVTYVNLADCGMAGSLSAPSLSADGRSVVFLAMRENGYEADKHHVIVIDDIASPKKAYELMATSDGVGGWSRSPSLVKWSADGETLYLTAEDQGRSKLYMLPYDPASSALPRVLPTSGSIADVVPLADGRVFTSGSSLIDNSTYIMFGKQDSVGTLQQQFVSSNTHNGNLFGLSASQVRETWFSGAKDNKAETVKGIKNAVHAWVVVPSDFDPDKKYPLAMLVHGGPQGAWLDSWSTRWNPAVFAEQGYIVVCPNPTGSTGYGQPFCDSIKESWGGLPYHDLVACFDHLASPSFPYIDTTRAVGLGASYGGFMMNWIQGHPLGRRFRALVCHDGIFSTTSGGLATEELYFPNREFGGWFSDTRAEWAKWDPAAHTQHWKTPMLVIHSEKDYRLTMAEGLAAYNVLQVQGVRSEFLHFPDENHFVLAPENSRVWHAAVLGFLAEFSGVPAWGRDVLDEVRMDPVRRGN